MGVGKANVAFELLNDFKTIQGDLQREALGMQSGLVHHMVKTLYTGTGF